MQADTRASRADSAALVGGDLRYLTSRVVLAIGTMSCAELWAHGWTMWEFHTYLWCRFAGEAVRVPDPTPAPAPEVVRGLGFSWFMELRLFGSVANWTLRLLWWVIDQLGAVSWGAERWAAFKYTWYVAGLVVLLLILCYGLDRVCRPFIWIFLRARQAWVWLRGDPEKTVRLCVRDLDWRGPDTNQTVDNDYYRDSIRARSLVNRRPNHVVIVHEGHYARVARPSSRLKPVSRHGQLFEVGEVISVSHPAIRRTLASAPAKTLCLCRTTPCQCPDACMHVAAYAGISDTDELDLAQEVYSPLALCCSCLGRGLHAVRTGILRRCRPRCCCRRGCCRLRRARAPHSDGTPRHPDSDSEVGEMGGCKAECIAWLDRTGPKATLLCRGCCPDVAMPKLTPMLHRDVATSDVQGFPRKNGITLAPLCRAHSNQYLVARQGERCCVG